MNIQLLQLISTIHTHFIPVFDFQAHIFPQLANDFSSSSKLKLPLLDIGQLHYYFKTAFNIY